MADIRTKLILLAIFAFCGTFGIHIKGIDVRVYKLGNNSSEFKIEYKCDNGQLFRGEAFHLHDNAFFFFDASNMLYGMSLTPDERNSSSSFYTFARPVERTETIIKYVDDHRIFEFNVRKESIYVHSYLTRFDTNNTCFTKTRNGETFDFFIESLNNRRKINGKTTFDDDMPSTQRVELRDLCSMDLLFEFSLIELNSTDKFCKAPFDVKLRGCVLGAYTSFDIGHKVLLSLAG